MFPNSMGQQLSFLYELISLYYISSEATPYPILSYFQPFVFLNYLTNIYRNFEHGSGECKD